jgi:hypothetical protein
LAAVKQNGMAIGFCKNPSETVQLAAVQEYGYALKYCKNPSEAVQLAAVQQNGLVIKYIDNPNETVQLAAVKQNGKAIGYCKNPSNVMIDYLSTIKQDIFLTISMETYFKAISALNIKFKHFDIVPIIY